MKSKPLLKAGMLLLCLMPISAMGTTKTVNLRIVETSDVHGYFFPYDFVERKPLKGTLARVSTYVERLRREFGKNVLLLDNGDILQGQPTCYWSNYVKNTDENIAASMVNYLKYDAQAIGNHDVETGHDVYDKWIKEVNCPVLGANIIDKRTGKPYVKPYAIFYRDGVKIAVLGMLTPTIPCWLNESLWQGLEFRDMVESARQWMRHLKEVEQPDLVIGLFHSGKEGGIVMDNGLEEDATARVAREVPGFDIIFFGHDHQVHNKWVKNKEGKDVLLVDPSCYGKNIAEAEIELTFQNGHLTKKDIKGEIVSVLDEEIDQQMMDHFQTKIDQVKAYVNRKIGRFEHPIYTRESFFGNSAFTDLIHNLQLQISKADVSFNAPLSFNTTIQAGDVTQGDMFKLYRFENLLYVLRMTGEEIRKHLEFSYDMWTNTMKSPEDHALLLNDNSKEDQQRTGFQYYTFNFDSACGIDYEVDLTKPDGQKVHILQLSNGQPFDEKKWYKVVMNSYRANGGGELLTRGAGIPKDSLESRVLFHTPLDQRHYLTQEIEQMGTIDPKPNHNWRFVPEAWVKPALKRDSLILFGR